jgi:hypothetical protein
MYLIVINHKTTNAQNTLLDQKCHSLKQYFVRNFTSADLKIRHHMTPSWSAHRSFSWDKHRYKVPCALQNGIARKKIRTFFPSQNT